MSQPALSTSAVHWAQTGADPSHCFQWSNQRDLSWSKADRNFYAWNMGAIPKKKCHYYMLNQDKSFYMNHISFSAKNCDLNIVLVYLICLTKVLLQSKTFFHLIFFLNKFFLINFTFFDSEVNLKHVLKHHFSAN